MAARLAALAVSTLLPPARQFCSSAGHSVAAHLPLERLQHAITPHVGAALMAQGYAVVDGVLGRQTADALRSELLAVRDAGLMHLNKTHLVTPDGTRYLAKAQILEAELSLDAAVRTLAPLLSQLDSDGGLAALLSLRVPRLRLAGHAIKLQHNLGSNGSFPMHFDSDEALDGRRVTAIMYLNPAWEPHHGGQLRLYPFPAPPVDVEPLHDRLVLFSAARMLHRVLPSTEPRDCFTIWLSEARPRGTGSGLPGGPLHPPQPSSNTLSDDADAEQQLWRYLMHPALRQHVCKLAYADEWERSIAESHPDTSDTRAAQAQHRHEVAVIRGALAAHAHALEPVLQAAALLQSGGHSNVAELDAAIALLRRVAAHVDWF